ncbi:MAG: DUF3710 domain-containing protein [Aeromicrobium sp.]|uniref:DUF3710 domain-containing protein n=1 Tax=Aeromicrobium sp. TaxID=1871063 RepID=UPI0025C07FC1|nr:DUF3710 domain-containing protein [Aeromicrobium sp.]MCK5891171.1 DUF3710 domain-containing protein [Aeromicrobium sp.]MDF1705520.1 DUF3710 domain-containing protein [Aeromicrobium sp.]
MGIFSPRRRTERDARAEAEADQARAERAVAAEQAQVDSETAGGPWDVADQPELGRRLDFGALRFSVPEGYVVQRPANDDDGLVPVVLLRGPEGALRLRVFAAPRDGGLWDELRADVVREVQERKGTAEEVDGPFGTEVRCVLPVTTPDGAPAVQPSRVIGVDGPRWTVRGTFLGPVAKDPRDDGDLMGVFRGAVVVRGPEARRPGEVLPLTLPAGAREPAETDQSGSTGATSDADTDAS